MGIRYSTCFHCRPLDHPECPDHLISGCTICDRYRYRWRSTITIPGTTSDHERVQKQFREKYVPQGYHRANIFVHSSTAAAWVTTQLFCRQCNNGMGGPPGAEYREEGLSASEPNGEPAPWDTPSRPITKVKSSS